MSDGYHLAIIEHIKYVPGLTNTFFKIALRSAWLIFFAVQDEQCSIY